MAWGLEARVPFLDKEFLDVSMTHTPPHYKMHTKDKIEKYILRKAFDTPDNPYLPDSILWRQKEQFSDGVGYNWIDGLKEWCNQQVTDAMLREADKTFPKDPPTTKEAYVYRTIFEKHFSGYTQACVSTVMRWIPRKDWGCDEDPSGRAQKNHAQAYAPLS
jgi:asparagine synthase (glutamine-hydrolysing)